MCKGIIFDFNGTLVWDSPVNEKAWNLISYELRGQEITAEEFRNNIHGRTNKQIIQYLLGGNVDEASIAKIAARKEERYRQFCLELGPDFQLAKGVNQFLDWLKERRVPIAIATASGKENIDFYIKHLFLLEWFEPANIVYDDGSFRGKPEPDIYLIAANRLNLKPQESAVFEDSISGLLAAQRAGIGKVIALQNEDNKDSVRSMKGISLIIQDFRDLDYSLLIA